MKRRSPLFQNIFGILSLATSQYIANNGPGKKLAIISPKAGQLDTLALIENLNDPQIPLNECAGFRDLHIAPLVSSTGILDIWELLPYHGGMLLRYPHKDSPNILEPFEDIPLLYRISEEYKERGRVLGVGSVGVLNRLSASGRIKEYIMVAEALQNKKIAALAEAVAARADRIKVVLIAGPSSSGKTTTAKKLAIQLKVLGFEPIPIELDNFFVDRTKTPLDAEGKPDFECLEALDIAFLNELLLRLFAGEDVEMPIYDFKAGARKSAGQTLRLTGKEILILEGIHGLNDALTPKIPHENKFKIYVSALTQLNLDDHNRISTTDYRLLRRMVRDYNFRGHSAKATLAMWPSVQRGERAYIFPLPEFGRRSLQLRAGLRAGRPKGFRGSFAAHHQTQYARIRRGKANPGFPRQFYAYTCTICPQGFDFARIHWRI